MVRLEDIFHLRNTILQKLESIDQYILHQNY